MKSQDVFGVIVRTIGLLIIIDGLWLVVLSLDAALTPLPPAEEGVYSILPMVLIRVLALLFGMAIFFGADGIVRLAYRRTISAAGMS